MRLLALVVGSGFLVAVAVGLILATPELGAVGGEPHEAFETMMQGGAGSRRHDNVLWLGGFFGAASLVFYGALMAFGARKGASLRGLGPPLLMCVGAAVLMWIAVLVSYGRYILAPSDEAVTLFFALPAPSAIMLYGLFPVTILFNLLYVIGFERWILTEKDVEDYERVLERRRGGSS